MKNSLLVLVSVLLISILPVKAAEYIYPSSFGIIGDYTYTVETNDDTVSLVKYSFPALVEVDRVALGTPFPNIVGSTAGFLVNNGTEYTWSQASEEDKALIRKFHAGHDHGAKGEEDFAPSEQTLTETTHYITYNTDLDKVASKDITNVYVFRTVYEDDPSTLSDDNLAGAVEDKFCGGKKKGKKGQCKKLLLRTK